MNIDPILECLTVGVLQANCWIVGCPRTREAVVIDPGGEAPRILERVRSTGLKPVLVVNTHGHIDHVAANAEVAEAFGAPVAIHRDDLFFLDGEDVLGLAWLVPARPSPKPSVFLAEGTSVAVGDLRFRVLHTPGHSPGSCCLLLGAYLLSGDTLLAGSVGRTDLPGGDPQTLMDSLARKVLTLPPETRVLPGHGPETVLSDELQENPFLPGTGAPFINRP
ncbi:MAG: MBL fold metallo-hydrolase [Acidobacteria bacterium]|nr:MBL fold metallo-hydrolase [Acidobacteriota bacterium]